MAKAKAYEMRNDMPWYNTRQLMQVQKRLMAAIEDRRGVGVYMTTNLSSDLRRIVEQAIRAEELLGSNVVQIRQRGRSAK